MARSPLPLSSLPASFGAMIWWSVVGHKPTAPAGPFSVRFSATQLDLQLGAAGSPPVSVRVGVWLPKPSDATTDDRRDLPILIYAPGWGDHFDDNTALTESLASHGYGVVAIDDIARDPKAPDATADDEGARFATFDVDTADRQTQFMEDANRRVALAAQKVRAVLDAVQARQSRDPLFARFDFDRIGIIGASFGGATAAEAPFVDGRIRAAINLDGLVFGKAADEIIKRPYLEMNSSIGVVPLSAIDDTNLRRRFFARLNVQQIARQQRQLQARGDAVNVTIAGVRHSDYTDQLYERSRILAWRPLRERPLRPDRVRAIIDGLAVAFFDLHLKQMVAAKARLSGAHYPEAVIEYGRGPNPAE